jgi:hypothetical protein
LCTERVDAIVQPAALDGDLSLLPLELGELLCYRGRVASTPGAQEVDAVVQTPASQGQESLVPLELAQRVVRTRVRSLQHGTLIGMTAAANEAFTARRQAATMPPSP